MQTTIQEMLRNLQELQERVRNAPLPQPIAPGDIVQTWCSRCGMPTPHRFSPGSTKPLECITCQGEENGL